MNIGPGKRVGGVIEELEPVTGLKLTEPSIKTPYVSAEAEPATPGPTTTTPQTFELAGVAMG